MNFRFATLALGACFMMIAAACQRTDGDPVTLGPEVSIEDVLKALSEPTASVDFAAQMQPGAFAHWQDVQTIAASYSMVVADTGQTVDERDETADPSYVWFNVLERKFSYVGNESREVATERAMRLARKTDAASQAALFDWTPVSKPWTDAAKLVASSLFPNGVTTAEAAARKVKFHGLKRSVQRVPPPELVRARPNCGGVRDCLIALHTIEFDQVVNGGLKPMEKIHYTFKLSPDVPFLASLMDRCMTTLVSIGTTTTLFSQCAPVVDFHF